MTPQKFGSAEVSGKFLSILFREREVAARAELIAQHVSELFPDSATVLYLIEESDGSCWAVKAAAGDVHLESKKVPLDSGTLGILAGQRTQLLFSGSELRREDYAHLHTRRTLFTLCYLPIFVDEELIGALELASFGRPLKSNDLHTLSELLDYSGPALLSALKYEEERNSHLQSISRLAQLYDIEKVFNSTLEMEELMPIITSKVREILEAQAVNLWMVKDEHELLLMSREGADPTLEVGSAQRSGEGAVADVSDTGEPRIISDPEDEYLARRNLEVTEGAVFSLIATPLVTQGNQVGVIEAINKQDGTPFDEDDLFLLNSVAEAAAGALNNAALLQAERKVQILETLVKVSAEITSTLNLDRVLQTVVNVPGAVIPYERAAIALEQSGKLRLRAVSGMAQVLPGDRDLALLEPVLQWAATSNDPISVTRHGDEIKADREDTRRKFATYFEQSGMRAFHSLPLADDEGRIGILSLESRDPDFLSTAHQEMLQVLGAQATVALRNASLYKEVPFIGVLEPLIQKKRKFLALEKRKRTVYIAIAAAAVLFLVLFPFPMRVDGNATTTAAHLAQVQPAVSGVVRQVYVREGQRVEAGQVLADLEDWDYRAALAAATAKYETASSEMNRALATNDSSEAGIQRAAAAYWGSEVERDKQRLERTHIRAPITGWVTTPHIEDFAGRRFAAGDTFAEIIDGLKSSVDVALDEEDVGLVRAGARGAIKLESFPNRTFRGDVSVVSPRSQVEGDKRFFFARITLPNADGLLRPGMQGRGKISVGWRPVGFVILRRPALWAYAKLWSWFGW
jgi:RND family efflux transporter MFP subunit